MSRTLRGAWSRRSTLLPLFLLTLVVVAGVVAVLGFADRAGSSLLLTGPLLLLGAVAVPAAGRELAAVRRPEIALARLRGITGGQLTGLLAVEPLLVLALAGAVGFAVGAASARVASRWWSGVAAGWWPGVNAAAVAAAVVVLALVAVLLGMAHALREPLLDQVGTTSRPRAVSSLALVGQALVLVGAVVAVYRSGASGSEPDWITLLGPALVGLAFGQLAVWLIQLGARLAVSRTARGSLPAFLAVRRLARVADAATALRLLVAAAVVAGLALTGAGQVDDWTDATARLRAGAPLVVTADTDAAGVLAMTEKLDPDGQWLMGAVVVPGAGSVVARRAFLEMPRFERVLGDFFATTPAAPLTDHLDELIGDGPGVVSDDQVTVTVRGVSRRRSGVIRPRITVIYLDQDGQSRRTKLRLDLARTGAPVTATSRLAGCSGGCTLEQLVLERSPGDSTLPWILTDVEIAGHDQLERTWLPADLPGVEAAIVDEGILATATAEELVVSASAIRPTVLATESATWPDVRTTVLSPGGDVRVAKVLARLPALPLVGADGLLADLATLTAGAPPTVPAAEVLVLARADTPTALLGQLVDATGGEPRTLADEYAATAAATGASQARVYSLVAGCCLLVGVLVLLTAGSRRRGAWRHDVAALRAIGVDHALLRRSGRIEVALLSAVVALASAAGIPVSVWLLLGDLSLVRVPEHAVPLVTGVGLGPLLVTVLLTALATALVLARSRSVEPERTRPATLREGGAR